MRWKPHVRFGGRAGETHPPKRRQGAPVRSHGFARGLIEVRRHLQRREPPASPPYSTPRCSEPGSWPDHLA